jgi:hypothetical protein
MARIKLDLHHIYNNSRAIDDALQQAFDDAIDKKIREVEIIPGKGSGQLRKKVGTVLTTTSYKKAIPPGSRMTARISGGYLCILNSDINKTTFLFCITDFLTGLIYY